MSIFPFLMIILNFERSECSPRQFETLASLKTKGRVVSLLETEFDTTLLGINVIIYNFSERLF